MLTINAGTTGSAGPYSAVCENGIAPRSSTSGTMEMKNTIKYFFNIQILSEKLFM
jgi:hypothetical protein